MSAFHFRLERLRRVREIQEELERERWLEAELRVRHAEGVLARLADEIHRGEAELRERQSAAEIEVSDVLRDLDAVDRLRRARRTAQERLRTARFQADRLRQPWEARRREVEGLDRLEGRAKETWRREERRLDARWMDEVAGSRAAHAARSAMAAQVRGSSRAADGSTEGRASP